MTRGRILAGGIVGLLLAVAAMAWSGTSRLPRASDDVRAPLAVAAVASSEATGLPRASDDVRALTIPDPDTHWQREGFVQMVPPVKLPTTRDQRDRITVWLKVPEGAAIRTLYLPDQGRYSLQYPPGSVAERIEYYGYARAPDGGFRWTISDVRGTRFEAGALEVFHIYLPTTDTPGAPLRGYEWPRGYARLERRATDLAVSLLRRSTVPGQPVPADAGYYERYRRLNDCGGCHVHNKPRSHRQDHSDLPNRATDASGLYAVMTVLSDEAPLDEARDRDRNAEDPFISVWCGKEPALLETDGRGGKSFTCRDQTVPVGRLDLRTALARGDVHAIGVCRSRRYLFDHLDATGRRVFAPALEACGAVR